MEKYEEAEKWFRYVTGEIEFERHGFLHLNSFANVRHLFLCYGLQIRCSKVCVAGIERVECEKPIQKFTYKSYVVFCHTRAPKNDTGRGGPPSRSMGYKKKVFEPDIFVKISAPRLPMTL